MKKTILLLLIIVLVVLMAGCQQQTLKNGAKAGIGYVNGSSSQTPQSTVNPVDPGSNTNNPTTVNKQSNITKQKQVLQNLKNELGGIANSPQENIPTGE